MLSNIKFIKDDEHKTRINELIKSSSKIIICSGWIFNDGVKLLSGSIARNLNNKENSIKIYVSTKHCQAQELNKLNKYSNFEFIKLKQKEGKVHTKLYYFEFEDSFIAIVGSANISKGALAINKELSIEIKDSKNSDNYTYIQEYIKSLDSLRE